MNKKVILKDKKFVLEEMIPSKEAFFVKCIHNGFNEIVYIDLENDNSKIIPPSFKGSVELTLHFPIGISNSNSINFYFKMRSWNRESEVYCYNPIDGQVSNRKILRTR